MLTFLSKLRSTELLPLFASGMDLDPCPTGVLRPDHRSRTLCDIDGRYARGLSPASVRVNIPLARRLAAFFAWRAQGFPPKVSLLSMHFPAEKSGRRLRRSEVPADARRTEQRPYAQTAKRRLLLARRSRGIILLWNSKRKTGGDISG